MDARSWRKVLLQWISECNFMERNYLNVEHTNIDAFFRNFCSKHSAAPGFDSITAFLEEHYPEFELNLDDDNTISNGDYIYVYSLLLHFSCVKSPDGLFHGICKKLNEQAQQCIAAFFQHLLDSPSMDKKHLRQAIAEVASIYVSSPASQQNKNESISSGSSVSVVSTDLQTSYSSSPLRAINESHMRTPNRKVVTLTGRKSPSTPKTTLLEERTRDLYKYKAELETERYEKGLLELQIVQNEQQILNLNTTQKKLRQQIQSLQDEILNQSVQPVEYDDQIPNQLSRQINEKEDEIFRLNDSIRIFGEDITLLKNKLRHADSRILDYRQTISDLELKLDDCKINMEKKDLLIKGLTDEKADLENFIVESRTASSNSRPDFNSSADCLDSSFARYTNSSGSLGSPENLGAAVIDVQLREKEHENAQLREELNDLRSNNKKLSAYIQEKVIVYKKEFNFDVVDDASSTNDAEDPATDFNFFLDCMNHLSLSYRDAKENIKQLDADVNNLKEKNADLQQEIEASKVEFNCLNDNLTKLTAENEKIKHEKDNLEKRKTEMNQSFNETIKELNKKLNESIVEQEKLQSYIDGLNEKIQFQMRKMESLDRQITKEENSKKDLQQKFDEVKTELLQSKAEIRTLEETAELLNCKLQANYESEELLKQRNQHLLNQIEEQLKKANETDAHLETLSNDIKTKESDLQKLGKEIVQLNKCNGELKERLEILMENYNKEKLKWETDKQNLQTNLLTLESQLQQLNCDIEAMESEKKEICKEIESLYILLKQQTNTSNIIMALDEIHAIVKDMLINKKENINRIDELEKIIDEKTETFQEIEKNLREEFAIKDKRLYEHKTEIEEISKQLTEAVDKIEGFKALINEMESKNKETIEIERKHTEELQKLNEEILSKQQDERKEWQNKQEQLEAELSGEKESYAASQTQLSNANQQLKDYEEQLRELMCTRSELEKDYLERLKGAQAKVELLIKENEELKAKLDAQSKEIISKAAEVSSYIEKYEQTVQALNSAVLQKENMQKAMRNLENYCEQTIATNKETIETLINQKSELENLLKKEQENLVGKVKELATCTEAYDKAMIEQKTAELELNELKENMETERNNFSALESELDSKVKELNKENENLQSRNELLEAKLKHEEEIRMIQQRENDEKLEKFQHVVEGLQEEKLKLEESQKLSESCMRKADSDIKQFKDELQKTSAQLEERNKELQNIRNQLKQVNKKLEDEIKASRELNLSYENQSKELAKLRMEILQLKEIQQKQCLELESLYTKTKKQSDDLFVAYEQIEDLKEDQNQRNEKIKKLESDLSKASEDFEQQQHKQSDEVFGLTKQMQTLECERKKINAELEQVSTKNSEADIQNDKLNDIIKEQEQKIEELRDLLRQTELCLKDVNDECAKSQGEVVSKEAEILILSDEIKQMESQMEAERDRALEIMKELEDDINDVVNILLNSSVISYSDSGDTIVNDILGRPSNRQSMDSLKKAVNRALIAIDQQHKSLMEIPNLQCSVKQLNEQQASTQMKLNELQSQFRDAQKTIEELEDQKKRLEKKLESEEKRLTDDLQNLHQVNDKLNRENETLNHKLINTTADLEALQINFGMLKAVNERLTIAQDKLEVEYNKTIEALNREQDRLKELMNVKELALEKLQEEIDELQRYSKDEETLKQENLDLIRLELMQSNAEKNDKLQEFRIKEQECTELTAENQELQKKNTELQTEAVELKKECISLRAELSTLNEKLLSTKEELETNLGLIEEANSNCDAYNEKLEKLNTKYTVLENDFKEIELQLNISNTESAALTVKSESLTKEKQNLTEELNRTKRESQELKQSIHNLNQKLALGDLEKEDLRRQLELLHKQVEVNSRYQTTSESKLKNIVETSQALERNLLCSENALKTTRATLEQSKVNVEKLETENKKLSHSLETVNKRIEKLALKLGESQALTSKSERENEKLTKLIDNQKNTIDTLQREKEIQQLECKTLKERLNRMDQQLARVQNAEKTNANLMAEKQKLETAEVDLKAKFTKLKNTNQKTEDRLRKMTNDCARFERENVNLTHQIGALNTEIRTLKSNANETNNAKIADLNKTITAIRLQSKKFEELNGKLSSDCSNLQQQNQNLADQLSKVVLALEISKAKSDQLGTEVQQLQTELKSLQQQKISMEQAQDCFNEQIETHRSNYQTALSEKRELEQKVEDFEKQLKSRDAEIECLRQEISELHQNDNAESESLSDKTSKLVSEVENLRTRLLAAEVMLEKEHENNGKLRSDNQILLAKYRDAKQRIEDEIASSEERIKENRLELEGKLEKMKNKMKVLYTEEVTKMKAKLERETSAMRTELPKVKAENAKYQEHIKKLSNELMTVNDRMLECQKQNTYLMTKLKYAQNEDTQFKRPNGALIQNSIATIPRISSSQSIHKNLGTNLAMEDEEGEIFNNTYLADMKNGRMSEIQPEELQHRNSLLPPHLKSAYAIQYDHGLCEDEVKDGTSNVLDDSMSALLNSNTSCLRKKLIGVTHYRKPGPPTPSKNGGRLSLGGSSEPSREVLRESCDENTPTSSKTPARFGFFSSRFSLGSNNNTTRDENSPPKRRLSSIFKRKA